MIKGLYTKFKKLSPDNSTTSAPAPVALKRKSTNLWEAETNFGERPFNLAPYHEGQEFEGALNAVCRHTMTSVARMVSLWRQVRYLDALNMPGALVECGVWKGGASALMALAHMSSGPARRNLHLFDSFEGLPEPDAEHDGNLARISAYAGGRVSGQLETINKCVGPLSEVQELFESVVHYPAELLHMHKGWFQDTLPVTSGAIGPIAVLRLDGDWYASTKVCLEHLYELVIPGGFVIFDDYGCWEGARKAAHEFAAERGFSPFMIRVDAPCYYFIKGQAELYHKGTV